MPNRITAISPQKKNRHRYNIFINDAYGFSVSADLAGRLRTGTDLTDSQIDAIQAADRDGQAFALALQYLGYRPRSRTEVIDYLEKKEFQTTSVESAVSRLESYDYIDDESFARFWIESRERHRPRGQFALRYELRSKGIADSIIDRLLADQDEHESAWRAVSKKCIAWKTLGEVELKKRIHALLRRRGFTFATCEDIVRRALEEDE